MSDRFPVLCLVLAVSACGSPGERLADGTSQPQAASGAGGPIGVHMQGDRCVVSREAYRAWAKDSPCLANAGEMLARAQSKCPTEGPGPKVFRCNGNLSFPFLDQVGAGTVCTYDGSTGEFLGANVAVESGFTFCPERRALETKPVVEHCGRWLSSPGYCGPGVSGMPTDAPTARPVTFTLKNASADTLYVDDPDGTYPQWSILAGGASLALNRPTICECPNHHCIVDAGRRGSGAFEIPPGGELTWTWDGRVGTLVTERVTLTCERLALAPGGALLVLIPYRKLSGSGLATATFDNPAAQPVIITAR